MSRLAYDVCYTTDKSIEHVKSWLRTHCDGAWRLERENTADKDEAWESLKVFFEFESYIGEHCGLASQNRPHVA
jgi:hypothetical protein